MENGCSERLPLEGKKVVGNADDPVGADEELQAQLSIMREEDAHRAFYITEHWVRLPEALLIQHISRVFTSFVVLCVVFV